MFLVRLGHYAMTRADGRLRSLQARLRRIDVVVTIVEDSMKSAKSSARMLSFLFSVLSLLAASVAMQAQDVAFVNVNVLSMDRERVLEGQTVWISGTHIRA